MSGRDHMQLVLDRYVDRSNIGVHHTPEDQLFERYLSKVLRPEELKRKVILEIGAGCSQYIPLFLNNGCARYLANDLIPERLAATRSEDPRYVELPGDFLKIDVPEPVDIVFSTLTMMFLKPYFREIAQKIHSVLRPGGLAINMDPNHFCALNVARMPLVRGPNPTRLFNPFSFANLYRGEGFEVEKLVPFTARYPAVTGNWLLGSAFWMRARKK